MPQPKKSSPKSAKGSEADDAQSTLAAVRELLTKSLMLPSDRLRETLDDAVRRGRITRADAEELIDRLMVLGRGQTEDALARLEGWSAGSRSGSSGSKSRGACAGRPAPTACCARSTAPAAPPASARRSRSPSYDDLTAAQIGDRLGRPLGVRAAEGARLREAQREPQVRARRRSRAPALPPEATHPAVPAAGARPARLDLTVDTLAYGGNGVARLEGGYVVFVAARCPATACARW